MEISLEKLFSIIRKSIVVILVFAVIGGALAYVGTKLFIAPTYVSSLEVNIIGAQEQGSTIAENNNQWVYANRIAKTCVTLLTTDDYRDQIKEMLGTEHKPKYTVTYDEDTTVLTIKTSDDTPIGAYEIANAIALTVNDHLVKCTQSSISVIICETPRVPDQPSAPNAVANAALVAVLMAVLVVGIRLMSEMIGARIKDEDTLVSRYDAPVIAVIPDFNEPVRGNKYAYKARNDKGGK